MKKVFSLFLVVPVMFLAVAVCVGFAADFPNKPIKLIVPWGAGGNADVQVRLLVKASEKFLGQPIAVVNKLGGATIPGVTEALQAKPDGYTPEHRKSIPDAFRSIGLRRGHALSPHRDPERCRRHFSIAFKSIGVEFIGLSSRIA